MALISEDLFGLRTDKVKRSIERIRAFEPPEGYFLGFSGGKDSVVIKALADMAGVRYDAHYHVTTVDLPELTKFIRQVHPDVILDRPRLSMRQLIIKNMTPPTRWKRYCCSELKETNGKGRVTMTGARWAESKTRKENQGLVTIFNGKKAEKTADEMGADYRNNSRQGIVMNDDNDPTRRTVELCYRTNKTIVNPIIDWTDSDIWDFIKAEGIPYCSLYDEGRTRLGCVGCPLAATNQRRADFKRWPLFYKLYLHAFDDMLKARIQAGKPDKDWKTAEDVMRWWVDDERKFQISSGQIRLTDILTGGGDDSWR